jgi:hypothetical protein
MDERDDKEKEKLRVIRGKDHLQTKIPWPESSSELYRPCDPHLSAKLMPTFADRGCHVVSVTDLLRP